HEAVGEILSPIAETGLVQRTGARGRAVHILLPIRLWTNKDFGRDVLRANEQENAGDDFIVAHLSRQAFVAEGVAQSSAVAGVVRERQRCAGIVKRARVVPLV